MLIYILIRYGLIRYMLIINIAINIDTIRVIFYIWQRNNLLPIFFMWNFVGENGEVWEVNIYDIGAIFIPLLSSKINGFCYFDIVSGTT